MKKIWTNNKNTDTSIIDSYCFKDGVILDNQLTEYDIYGSIAHSEMLSIIGILKSKEYEALKKQLKVILDLHKKGKFQIAPEDEDVHTKVEAYLTEKLGELGKKIHTGRSRNDQVLVDLRLYTKSKLIEVVKVLTSTAKAFVEFAKKYEYVPMPGYTHMQKAMPSSLGMWAGSFAEQLLDIMEILDNAYELNDQSPLGSGAAYGISLPIDREFTAKKLGFSKVQSDSLYSQITRPTFGLLTQQALVQVMLAASRFASDLLLFTTSEFSYFDVDESICTGSSIMPQKKNLDLMEYVRAKTNTVISLEVRVAMIASGLPSGYNADFGETKGPLMDSFAITIDTLKVLEVVAKSIKPNKDNLIKACTPEIYATHHAYEKVVKGVSFRNAYLEVKNNYDQLPTPDPTGFLKVSKHTGGTGNLKLNTVLKTLTLKKNLWEKKASEFEKVINSLLE